MPNRKPIDQLSGIFFPTINYLLLFRLFFSTIVYPRLFANLGVNKYSYIFQKPNKIRGCLVCIFLLFRVKIENGRENMFGWILLKTFMKIFSKIFRNLKTSFSCFQYCLYICWKHFQLKMWWYNGK